MVSTTGSVIPLRRRSKLKVNLPIRGARRTQVQQAFPVCRGGCCKSIRLAGSSTGSVSLSVLLVASAGQEDTASKQFEGPTTVHEALDPFDFGHLSLDLPAAPRVGKRGMDRRIVASETRREPTQFGHSRTRSCLQPWIQRRSIPSPHHPSEGSDQRECVLDLPQALDQALPHHALLRRQALFRAEEEPYRLARRERSRARNGSGDQRGWCIGLPSAPTRCFTPARHRPLHHAQRPAEATSLQLPP